MRERDKEITEERVACKELNQSLPLEIENPNLIKYVKIIE